MSSYIHHELILFFQSVTMGVVLLLCYSFLIAFRRVIPHHPGVTSAEDIIFWIFAGLAVFVRIYATNQGILRSFVFLGLLLGAILGNAAFRPLFVEICERILAVPVWLVKKIIKVLLFLGKRCKISMSNSAKKREVRRNQKTQMKRGRQFDKIREKEQRKENRI